MPYPVAACRGHSVIAASGFDPALYGTVKSRVDFDDLSTLFQDTAATSPVTTTTQSAKRVNDKGTLGGYWSNATAAPTYDTFSGALNGAKFDGSQFLTNSLGVAVWKFLHDGSVNRLVLMDLIVSAAAATGIILDNENGTANNAGFAAYLTDTSTKRFGGLITNGSGSNVASGVTSNNAYTIGQRHVVAWRWNYNTTGDDQRLRVDGVELGTAESSATPGSGNPLFAPVIGRYASLNLSYFSGSIRRLWILTGVADADIPALETGIQLP